MNRKDLLRILRRYRQNKATQEERSLIDHLYESMGERGNPTVDLEEDSDLEGKYWAAISSSIRSPRAGRTRALVTWSSVGIAACLLAGFAIYFGTEHTDHDPASAQSVVHVVDEDKWIVNDAGDAKRVILDDGTRVTLEPSSRLNVSGEFGIGDREVHLEGEAYFEVVRDTLHPFLVRASGVTARVLGTSFRVKAFREDKDVVVAVSEGKVKVYTQQNGEDPESSTNVVLTPNQKIVYDREAETILRGIVENPRVVLPAQEVRRMRFEERPVTEILEALARLYNVEIEFDESSLSTCILTTSIAEGDLYGRLDVICKDRKSVV